MKINGIDLKNFNARLVERSLESSEIRIDTEWPEKSLLPFIGDDIFYNYKPLKLDIEYKGNFQTTNLNKSKLIAQLSKCEITEFGLGKNILFGYLSNHSVKIDNGKYQRVEYELMVIEYMPEVETTNFKIINPGTGITPATIEITPSKAGAYVLYINQGTINEVKITLNNMIVGKARTIGIESGVFEGVNNKFSDTIFFTYPKLIPGENNIKITPAATIKTKFKPRII
ncbi:phage tail family protein [Helcococcus kunzii]|uniref:Uncharacterized protein n=1 Tax=Helcococcus kunzii ATCC 51366 TaxID=883114 RepID=H3NPC2_9FIRM|nr:hypothetical protein [Helcococcus kunzii]EHR33435.1 hypothetical protein HMPREF9709_01183 [Helcococcus kunzii ATCC 51366]QUY65080.1 hypothetical protein GUI37_05940 [Helcococcus kunzii]